MLRATRRASGFRAAAGTSARRCASGFPEASTIWKDGELIPWQEANVHILSTAVQFGSSLFEGIRCYGTPSGPAIVHLDGHLRRLLDSCKMYRVDVPYSAKELAAACFDVVEANGLHDGCYIRPMVLRGYGAVGMDGKGSPVECYIPAWKWGAYLGADAFSTGIDCCTASWARPAPNTFPGMAKAAGNYNNAALIKMEAQANGYVEAVALGSDGMVSEGSGQNLFVVRDGARGQSDDDAHLSTAWSLSRHRVLRRDHDAADQRLEPAGADSRLRDAARRRGGCARPHRADPAGGALRGGRALLHGHRDRGDADRLAGPHRHRQWQAGPDHRADTAEVPGHHPRPIGGCVRLDEFARWRR